MCICTQVCSYIDQHFDHTRTPPLANARAQYCTTRATHTQIEESAKKSVEAATSSSSVLKLYNRWYENVEAGEGEGEKKGLLQRMKGAIKGNSRPEVCVCVLNVVCQFGSRSVSVCCMCVVCGKSVSVSV